MKMICNCCQKTFDKTELVKRIDDTGWWWYECPHCGDEEVYEAVKCEKCGEWISKKDSIEGFCKDCAEKLLDEESIRNYIVERQFTEFFDFLCNYFTNETITRALMDFFTEEAKCFTESQLDDFVRWYNKNV